MSASTDTAPTEETLPDRKMPDRKMADKTAADKTLTHWRMADADTEAGTDGAGDTTTKVEVDPEDAEAAWAEAVHPVLADVAGGYQALITQAELAARLQDETGISTRSNAKSWMTRVLATSAAADVAADRPPLTALVVHQTHGTVGPAYEEVLRLTGEPVIDDEVQRERHAAEARMECYRWAGAKMPADGGHAALSPRFDLVLTRGRKKAREEAVADVCTTCFMAIPPTGVCDTCG